ncbi:MAG: K(+)-transporting ATPase subunit F [Gammaproteobacteria bacterium]|nr:K(+)-transporting ATPase subunit F [Gammaproteobacteria bacterium]
MSLMEVIGLILSLVLAVYLVVALFFPERFS